MLELEPANSVAGKVVKRLTPVVMERREKLKDEMMGEGAGAAARLLDRCCADVVVVQQALASW